MPLYPITLAGTSLRSADTSDPWWGVTNIAGWGGTATRVTSTERLTRPGATIYGSGLNSQGVTLDGFVRSASLASLEAARDLLLALCPLIPVPLVVANATGARMRTVVSVGAATWEIKQSLLTYSMDLLSPDPRLYSTTAKTATSTGSDADTGIVLGSTLPFTFADTDPGVTSAVNVGTFPAPLKVTITGPATNPRVTVGQHRLSWGLTLPAGKTLVADCDARRSTYGTGGMTDALLIDRDWPAIDPGTSQVSFHAEGLKPGSRALFTWRDTWR